MWEKKFRLRANPIKLWLLVKESVVCSPTKPMEAGISARVPASKLSTFASCLDVFHKNDESELCVFSLFFFHSSIEPKLTLLMKVLYCLWAIRPDSFIRPEMVHTAVEGVAALSYWSNCGMVVPFLSALNANYILSFCPGCFSFDSRTDTVVFSRWTLMWKEL